MIEELKSEILEWGSWRRDDQELTDILLKMLELIEKEIQNEK